MPNSSSITVAFKEVDRIAVLVSKISECQGRPYKTELEPIRSALPKRRREFIAGRTVARLAMQTIGAPPEAILTQENRIPSWPIGVVGSISHNDEMAGAAVASADHFVGVGFDLETSNAVTPDLYASLLTSIEVDAAANSIDPNIATLIFSCKEAVYKAVNPLAHEYLDFSDISIRFDDGRFSAICDAARKSSSYIHAGRGYYEIVGGIVRTLFLVRSSDHLEAKGNE